MDVNGTGLHLRPVSQIAVAALPALTPRAERRGLSDALADHDSATKTLRVYRPSIGTIGSAVGLSASADGAEEQVLSRSAIDSAATRPGCERVSYPIATGTLFGDTDEILPPLEVVLYSTATFHRRPNTEETLFFPHYVCISMASGRRRS